MKRRIKKFVQIAKQYGLKIAIKDMLKFILKKVFKVKIRVHHLTGKENKFNFADVLFIDGCGPLLPHPTRYRVDHQIEQLQANNISCEKIYYPELSLDQVRFAHTFVFFRCPVTPVIEEFIAQAKALNKTVIYDIDDLVIDTVYTDTNTYVQNMSAQDKSDYDNYVNRMKKCFTMCDSAITTTERLDEELGKYVPEVFINRNTASMKMMELSERALEKKATMTRTDEVRLGYFSGSISHNADYELIKPVLLKLLEEHKNVKLHIVGILDIPEELSAYKDQIVTRPFVDWEQLPELISSIDINLAPIEMSIFNEAKSENKWVEAALVKVVTIASKVGAFERMIEDGVTGVLVDNTEDAWYQGLSKLIADTDYRNKIANNAYEYCKDNCLTIYTGKPLANHIRKLMKPSVGLLFPSTGISGGLMVALKHGAILQDAGCEVTIAACLPEVDYMEYAGHKFPVVALPVDSKESMDMAFDKAISTMWITPEYMQRDPNIGQQYYLVQGFETDFYGCNERELRIQANATYSLRGPVKYLTISKWCQGWLKDKFGIDAQYAPNGLDTTLFTYQDRAFNDGEKIKVLIEGDCRYSYKGIDESFEIAGKLDPERFEIYYMTYTGATKEWYKVDKLFTKVPYQEVKDVYGQCHILLKSSTLESFSYPPLEMMATGGFVVAAPNGGNAEILADGENCLMYQTGDIEAAVAAIERIVDDADLRAKLAAGAKSTVESREWENIRNQILALYDL